MVSYAWEAVWIKSTSLIINIILFKSKKTIPIDLHPVWTWADCLHGFTWSWWTCIWLIVWWWTGTGCRNTQKKNFRILYPTTIIVSPRAANTSVGSSASPGTMDTIFTISGIFFLYSFLVGLSGKTINGVHGARNVLHHLTIFTIFTISGIFFLYNFLVRDPGNQGKRAYSAWRMAG